MTNPCWPLFDLVIRTERLEMRPVREPDMFALVELAGRGIHDPADMPFLVPFTDLPSPERERTSMQFYWGSWANWSPDDWRLAFVVELDGECVGTQDVAASQFPVRRTGTTGSWVGRQHQGRGIGTEMRAGVLQFLFCELGALRAETEAFDDNAASRAVTLSLGYQPNGWGWNPRRGQTARIERFALDAGDWLRRDDIVVEGVGPELLAQFGL